MSSKPQIIERHTRCVEIMIRQRPGTASYILGGAVSADAAYAGTTPMITVGTGRSYQSRSLRRNKINRVEDERRGMTSISYDPTDYASATVPGDQQTAFLRMTEVDMAGVSGPEGPILVLPTPQVWAGNKGVISINGIAPNVAGLDNNLPPPDAMWFNFPRVVSTVVLFNDGPADLAFCMGPPGTQEFTLPYPILNSEQFPWGDMAVDLLSLRGMGGTAAFRLVAFCSNGAFI